MFQLNFFLAVCGPFVLNFIQYTIKFFRKYLEILSQGISVLFNFFIHVLFEQLNLFQEVFIYCVFWRFLNLILFTLVACHIQQ